MDTADARRCPGRPSIEALWRGWSMFCYCRHNGRKSRLQSHEMDSPLPFGSVSWHAVLRVASFPEHVALLSLLQHMRILCLPSNEHRRGFLVAKLLFQTARHVTQDRVTSR